MRHDGTRAMLLVPFTRRVDDVAVENAAAARAQKMRACRCAYRVRDESAAFTTIDMPLIRCHVIFVHDEPRDTHAWRLLPAR